MRLENIWLKALAFSLGVHLLASAFFFWLERPKRPSLNVIHLKLKSAYITPRPSQKPSSKIASPKRNRRLAKRALTKPAKPARKTLKKTRARPQKKTLAHAKKATKTAKARKKATKAAKGPPPLEFSKREETLLAKRLAALRAQAEERKLRERLAHLKKEGSLAGGISLGNTLSQTFAAKLMAHLKAFWAVPEILKDRKELFAEVELNIAPDGHLTSFRFLKRSGEPLFDEAVAATLKRADPLPAPGRSLTIPAVFRIY